MTTFFPRLPLDPSLYKLDGDALAFFKAQTGIKDDDELRTHILQVQAEAYTVYPYPCIRRFAFLAFKIATYPAYESIIKLGKERKGALLLDLGCCFGNDARKAISDGFPAENVILSDLHEEFGKLGNKLFKTSSKTFPVTFLAGDVFDPSFISPDDSPAATSASDSNPIPTLSTLTSLTPLQHSISVIHTGSFFFLFNEGQQRDLAHRLGTLISPLPGSMIVGSHIAHPDTEECKAAGGLHKTSKGISIFAHCPSSWKNLWAGRDGVFKPEEVVVWAVTEEIDTKIIVGAGAEETVKPHRLVWSVTRV